jgi:PAS domain-containing protein
MTRFDPAPSNPLYPALIENSLDLITVLDNRGTITFHSPSVERILGYSPLELLGTSAFDARYRPCVLESIGSVVEGADGVAVGIVNSRDITNHRSLQEHFRRAQQAAALGRFTASIVHEFRTHCR